jgi:SnoaL-like domain
MNRHLAALVVIAAVACWISPAAAQTPPDVPEAGGPCSVPHEYVRLINDGKYDSVGQLFADDAVYLGPDGKTRHGAKAIGAFYSSFLPRLKPELHASRFFEQGNECMMELENKSSQTGSFRPTAVDHFTIDSAGKISRFIVYLRPGSETAEQLKRALSNR